MGLSFNFVSPTEMADVALVKHTRGSRESKYDELAQAIRELGEAAPGSAIGIDLPIDADTGDVESYKKFYSNIYGSLRREKVVGRAETGKIFRFRETEDGQSMMIIFDRDLTAEEWEEAKIKAAQPRKPRKKKNQEDSENDPQD